ncbi:MAG: ester cyclase [Chloroflexota bacterium]
MSIAENKHLVWQYWQTMTRSLDRAQLANFLHQDVVWHGFEPLRNLHGLDATHTQFWQPFLTSMPNLVRRPYVFIGGHFEGHDWVCGTGDFIATFVNDLWNIPATGTTIHFRFGEFCKVEDGKITEIRIIIDLPAIMRQAGVPVLPANYGRDIWTPGPLAGDGVFFHEADLAQSQQTLSLVEEMIFGGLNKYDQKDQSSQGLECFWHPEMVWHGPVGIGSAYGMDEFKRNAQGPIVNAFPDRKGVGHQARLAEGIFAASTGWPSLVGTHLNAYMDWQPTGEKIGWNIMDFWRRDGDLLRENWVMIDLIGAAKSSGVDLLAKLNTPS